jgi:hypothetical protein
MKRENRRAISFITTLALVFTTFFSAGLSFATETGDPVAAPELLIAPAPISAEPTSQDIVAVPINQIEDNFNDISGHWGEAAINEAVTNGFVKGYADGTFKPDKSVTRAEFVTMINKALQLRDENTVNLLFKDVTTTNWFYEDIQKASYARYATGVTDTSFMPGKNITRQEAAIMLSRFLPKSGFLAETQVSAFPDSASVSTWAKSALAVVINKGYMSGYANGNLTPRATLTRAEAAKIIGKILENETIVREDISVANTGDILRNKIYVGDITIEKSVGEGEATLDNLTALSKVYVLGGGVNTVMIKDAVVIQLIVCKEGTKVRVLSNGETTIFETFVFNENLLVDENGASANSGDAGYENIINIEGTISADDAIRIAQEIASRMDNSGKLTSEQIVQSVVAILPEMAMTINPDGSINVSASPVATHRHREAAPESDVQIATAAISGVTAPVTGATPVSIIADTLEYTATISWSGTPTTFAAVTTYTAIITITPKTGYTLTGVIANFFTVVGATSTNSAASGVVSAVFPKTEVATLPVASCGTSHAGIGAFTAIASINETTTAYAIYTEAQLQHLALHLNSNAILMNDITFSATTGAIEGTPMGALSAAAITSGTALRIPSFTSGNFVSIGSDSYPYRGTFYGNNKVITGINITASAINYVGIFGYTSGATIKDLTTSGGSVTGDWNVGGVVGYSASNSTIDNVKNTGSVTGKTKVGGVVGENSYATVIDSYNTGTVNGIGNYVGGVSGWNDFATITNSHNTGSVSGSNNVGGVVGYSVNSSSTVTNSYNTGALTGVENVGGIVGNNLTNATVTDSYNTGNVSGNKFIGGIAGQTGTSTIKDSYNTGEIKATDICAGGIAGYSGGSTLSAVYNSGSVIGTNRVGGVVGNNGEASLVQDSFNTGIIIGSVDSTGGIIGDNYKATVKYSYNTGAVSGIKYAGGGVGYNGSDGQAAYAINIYNTGGVTGSGVGIGSMIGYNHAGLLTNCSWLEGTNLKNSLGIGENTNSQTTTTFTSTSNSLTSVYTSMSAIVTSAGGVAIGAITDIALSGTINPTTFNGAQGSYIKSGANVGITVTAISGTTVTVTTASSLATLVSPGGIAAVATSSTEGISTYAVVGGGGTWVMIKAVNASEPSKNRTYTIYLQ